MEKPHSMVRETKKKLRSERGANSPSPKRLELEGQLERSGKKGAQLIMTIRRAFRQAMGGRLTWRKGFPRAAGISGFRRRGVKIEELDGTAGTGEGR